MNGVAIWQYSDYGGQQDLNVDLTGITWNGYRTVDGWNGADDKWQYVENGQVVKNDWRKVDDRWYHFDETGYVQTGWQQINGHWYYFDTNHDGTFVLLRQAGTKSITVGTTWTKTMLGA